MKDRLAEKKIQQRSDIGLYHEEEELFDGNLKECRANDGIGRIAPDSAADQVRIPRGGGYDRDLDGINIDLSLRVFSGAYADEKEDLVDIESCTEWAVTQAQGKRWGNSVQ